MRAKFGVLEQTQGLNLQAKFHLNVSVVSASGGQNPQFLANFDIFGGSCTDPLLLMKAKFGELQQTHGARLPAKFRLDRFILSSCGGEKPKFLPFLPFFGFRHLVMSPIVINLRKLSTGAQLQTFPYPKASKSFLYSNAFVAKSGAQTLTFKSVTDKQTNRQTDRQIKKTQRFWPPRRRVKHEPHQTWHGDRGSRARSCTSKTFGGLTHSFAARGR